MNKIPFKSLCYGLGMTLLLLLAPLQAKGQLQMQPGNTLTGWTPDSLVRNVLLGEGVEVSNVRFNGSLTSINCDGVGKFTTGNTPTNLGISEGIVLSASALNYINTTGGNSTSSCGSYSDAALTALSSPNSTNNVAVLEFDFIPRSDSIKFRYVFASEEYYGFECTPYNDVFAFFLSGVSPSGGMYDNTNIALVPGTSTPITISTVNGGQSNGNSTPCVLTNTQYFVNNQSQTYVKHMDGFTTVLTAEAKVIPCHSYHLKMAVCNASDQALPSCVFLEANSLMSNAIQFDFENTANLEAPSDLYEGCEATINMTRPNSSSVSTRIDIAYSGTAVNGEDFATVNQYFYFPANTNSVSMTISPYMDGIAEGVETAKFVLSAENGCPNSDSVEFNILDTDPLEVKIVHDTLTSATSTVTLRADIQGGMPNRTVRWRNLLTQQVRENETITVQTSPDSKWIVDVQDFCGNYGADTVEIGIKRDFVRLSNDTTICADEPLFIDVILKDRTLDIVDSCVWYVSGASQPFYAGPGGGLTLHPEETTVYLVRSFVYWHDQYWEDVDSIRVIVIPLPEVHVSASTERLCEGQSTTLTGSGASQYSWDGGENFVNASSHTYMPDTTTTILVYGLAAGAECYGKDSVYIVVDTIPDIYLSEPTGVCGGESVVLSVATTAEHFMWVSNPPDVSLGGQEINEDVHVNPSSTTVYTVNATNGVCSNSESTSVAVEPMPIAIGEVLPKTVSLGSMEATFVDRSEYSTTRRWEFPDGVVKTEQQVKYVVPDDVDSVNVLLWVYNPYQCFDSVTVTVYVDHTTLWAPNAFTPDESTNRTFLVKTNDVQRYHIIIYDRHGIVVFESYDPEIPWDGTTQNGRKCPQGAYTYVISCHKITYPYDQIVQRGSVVLIR